MDRGLSYSTDYLLAYLLSTNRRKNRNDALYVARRQSADAGSGTKISHWNLGDPVDSRDGRFAQARSLPIKQK